jgi:hypothetical protein
MDFQIFKNTRNDYYKCQRAKPLEEIKNQVQKQEKLFHIITACQFFALAQCFHLKKLNFFDVLNQNWPHSPLLFY